MTHQELKDYLKGEYGGYALFEPENYDKGIIGVTDNGNVVYSYERLAEMLILEEDMTYEDAIEWLDYNTVRTIPYMGEFKPVMLMEFPDCDDDYLVGADTNGAPIYYYDNVPDEPVRHECLEDYMLLEEGETLPDPIIIYPLSVE